MAPYIVVQVPSPLVPVSQYGVAETGTSSTYPDEGIVRFTATTLERARTLAAELNAST